MKIKVEMEKPDGQEGFSIRDIFLVLFAILAILLFTFYGKAQSPGLSRWALGGQRC